MMKDEPISAAPAIAGAIILTLLVCTLVWLRYDGEAAGAVELMEPLPRGIIPWETTAAPASWALRMRCVSTPCDLQNVRVEYSDAAGHVFAIYRLCEVPR